MKKGRRPKKGLKKAVTTALSQRLVWIPSIGKVLPKEEADKLLTKKSKIRKK